MQKLTFISKANCLQTIFKIELHSAFKILKQSMFLQKVVAELPPPYTYVAICENKNVINYSEWAFKPPASYLPRMLKMNQIQRDKKLGRETYVEIETKFLFKLGSHTGERICLYRKNEFMKVTKYE